MTEISIVIGAGVLALITKLIVQWVGKRNSLDPARENVKKILMLMLTHLSYTDRSYTALRKAVGGYSDKELRIMLHEVGARQFYRGKEEWWYLLSRAEERIKKRQNS